MSITAALVQELRERTGAGLMECKKVLQTVNGDIEAAIDAMRKAGQAKADKKAGRVAAEGLVVAKTSADQHSAMIIETNCETDFVARDADFKHFVEVVADKALANKTKNIEQLLALPLDQGITVEQTRQVLISRIGENIQLRRIQFVQSQGVITAYVHSGRIGVLVQVMGGNQQLGKDLAMQIAATHPLVVSRTDVPIEVIKKEKEIFSAQAQTSGKPSAVIEKMIEGRINKFLDEVSLVGQPFVKDPNITIAQLLQKNNATVLGFTRFAVGEGIEKQTTAFAEEVMAQVRSA